MRPRLHPRVGNAPLTAGIPGFYTRDGYTDGVPARAARRRGQVGKERGSTARPGAGATTTPSAARRTALYRGDFNARWTSAAERPADQAAERPAAVGDGADRAVRPGFGAEQADRRDRARHRPLAARRPTPRTPRPQRLRALIQAARRASAGDQPFQPLRDAMQAQDGEPSADRRADAHHERPVRTAEPRQQLAAGVLGVTKTEGRLNDANQKLISEKPPGAAAGQIWLSEPHRRRQQRHRRHAPRSRRQQAWNAYGKAFCARPPPTATRSPAAAAPRSRWTISATCSARAARWTSSSTRTCAVRQHRPPSLARGSPTARRA